MSATTTLRMILLGEDKSAGKALKGVGSEADRSSSKMDKFHKVGTAAGVALAGGLALAGKAAMDMTKRAAEDQLGAAKLAQTLTKATGATKQQKAAVEEWITAQGKAYGVADDDLRPALSKLAVATGSVSKAQKLASLAMDVSAGTGKSLESVSMALAKAQNGNISGLGRLGIATKDAAGNTLTLKQVTQQLSDHYKGAAAAAATTAAGKQQILTVQMHELQEQIGYALIPAMQKLVSVGLQVVGWISKNTKTVGLLVAGIGSLLAVVYAINLATRVYTATQMAWTTVMALSRKAALGTRIQLAALWVQEKLAAAGAKIMAAGQWLLNAAMDANPIGLVVIAIAALVAGMIIAYKKSDTFRHIVQAAFHAVSAAAQAAFNWVKGHWKLLAAIIGGPIVAAAIVVISNWGKIRAGAANLWAAIRSGAAKVKAYILLPFQLARSAVSAVWQNMKQDASNFVGYIAQIPSRIRTLVGNFAAAGRALIQGLWRGVLGAARSAGGFVSSLVASIKSAINSALHLPLTVSFDKGPIHIHATLIPALAQGGIVTRPTTALIGEAGPEAVVPLSGANASRLGLGGGDVNVYVTASNLVDPQQTARLIQKELVKLKRQRGNAALGLA